MPANEGLNWKESSFLEVVAQSASCLRTAMSYAKDGCEVRKWVDLKFLEMLWAPCGHRDTSALFGKDIVRSELSGRTPKGLWDKNCDWRFTKEGENPCPQCYAGSLLPRVLLGSMDWFFECEQEQNKRISESDESPLLWVVAKLYDQLGKINFYRTLSSMEVVDPDYQIGQLLFRVPEIDYEWFGRWIADFSTLLREQEGKKEVDYCLVCKEEHARWAKAQPERWPEQFWWYDVSEIMSMVDTSGLLNELKTFLSLNPQTGEVLSKCILTPKTLEYREEALRRKREKPDEAGDIPSLLGAKEIRRAMSNGDVKRKFEQVKPRYEDCLYAVPDSGSGRGRPLPDALQRAIGELLADVSSKPEVTFKDPPETLYPKLANYFLWLNSLHPNLATYTVRYASKYRFARREDEDGNEDGSEDGNDQTPIQNPCFVIASSELPSSQLLAASRVALTHCLGPLEDQYAMVEAARAERRRNEKDQKKSLMHFALVNEFTHVEVDYIRDVVKALLSENSNTCPERKPVLRLIDEHMKQRADFLQLQDRPQNLYGDISLSSLVAFYQQVPIVYLVKGTAITWPPTAREYLESYVRLFEYNTCLGDHQPAYTSFGAGAVRTVLTQCINNAFKYNVSLVNRTLASGTNNSDAFRVYLMLAPIAKSPALASEDNYQVLVANRGIPMPDEIIESEPESESKLRRWLRMDFSKDRQGRLRPDGFGMYWIGRASKILKWTWEIWVPDSARTNGWRCAEAIGKTPLDERNLGDLSTKISDWNVPFVFRFLPDFAERTYQQYHSQ